MVCERCQKKVSKKESVLCQGFCGATFHAVCVNVDGPLQDQLALNGKNVFWMCDGCAELFANTLFREMACNVGTKYSALPEAVQSMQSKIENLQTAVEALTAKVEDKPSTPFTTPNLWPARNRINHPSGSSKRRRMNEDNPINVPTINSNVGTKSAGGIRTVQLNQRDDENLFWIYLSAFHPSTSEGQIASLVSECLELTDVLPKVVKLVPKGRDPNSLLFVSFKVGVVNKLKEKALACDTWPENVRFREFEDLRSKNGPKIVSLLPLGPSSAMDGMELSSVV